MHIALLVVLVLLVGFVILTDPAPGSKDKGAGFTRRNYAHRGLHTRDKTVPENSLAAFRAAAEKGYGIELDVQLSADGEVVVFHDATLDRVCGVEGKLEDRTLAQLQELRLCGTEEQIPLFRDVLELVAGRSPLIVELKTTARRDELCRKTDELLRAYEGDYCIESFDPRIVRWFKKNHMSVFRGQLITAYKDYRAEGQNVLTAFALSHGFLNVLGRPHFLAMKEGWSCFSLKFCMSLGAVPAVWTVRDPEHARQLRGGKDIIIFEHYRPDLYY